MTHRHASPRRAHVRFLRPAIIVAFAALALVLPPIGSSIVYIEGVTNDQLDNFDSRVDATGPTADQAAGAATAAVGVTIMLVVPEETLEV